MLSTVPVGRSPQMSDNPDIEMHAWADKAAALGAENARLRQRLAEEQHRADDAAGERDELRVQLADLSHRSHSNILEIHTGLLEKKMGVK